PDLQSGTAAPLLRGMRRRYALCAGAIVMLPFRAPFKVSPTAQKMTMLELGVSFTTNVHGELALSPSFKIIEALFGAEVILTHSVLTGWALVCVLMAPGNAMRSSSTRNPRYGSWTLRSTAFVFAVIASPNN